MNLRLRSSVPSSDQQGVASLVVVLILLVAMGLIVTFTNRTVIFEQKTAANQYRSTLAFEAAEAGLDWATAMLNKTEYITNACATSTTVADRRFRDRYLTVDPAAATITPVNNGAVVAACAYNQEATGTMNCSCPAAGTAPTATAPATTAGFTPGFAVAFVTNASTGTVDLVSYGCTNVINSATCGGDAQATLRVSLGQVSGLSTPPASPLTARGSVDVGSAALGVINPDPNTNGVTINAGGTIELNTSRVVSVPGTPGKYSLVANDPSLASLSEAGMFSTFFGMSKDAYKALPTTTVIDCSSGCGETQLRAAYDAGARQIWMNGNLTMQSNLTIGSATDPFVMVVDGSVEMRGDMQLFSVIYSTGITWDNTGGGAALLNGAAISEGNYSGTGTPDYYYDPNVMSRIRASATSFVRVPGSWRDF